jgi:hypothetical protein
LWRFSKTRGKIGICFEILPKKSTYVSGFFFLFLSAALKSDRGQGQTFFLKVLRQYFVVLFQKTKKI